MKLYAICHLPTGRYLPERKKGQRGYTHLKPVSPAKSPPRLFSTKGAAGIALTCWLKGKAETDYRALDGDTSSLSYTPIEGRQREDMAVVPMVVELADGKVVVDSVDLLMALEYAVGQDNGWDSRTTPDWFVALAAAQCGIEDESAEKSERARIEFRRKRGVTGPFYAEHVGHVFMVVNRTGHNVIWPCSRGAIFWETMELAETVARAASIRWPANTEETRNID